MPIYEYSCSKCGKQFEVLIRSDRDIPKKCTSCGATGIRKQFSSFAVSAAQNTNPVASCEGCGSAGTGCGSGSCPMSIPD
jgi:putative FmdB family regulatory protein